MYIYNTRVQQGNPKYYGMPHGATLQDELGGRGNYGIDGEKEVAETDKDDKPKDKSDDNFFCMTKTQLITGVLLGLVGGIVIYQLFIKTKNPTTPTPTITQ